mmetsp:Transcript_18303/g.27185  ORF Transcript_18303/g.27185 Transcript_18303/m.27185 type:complete len:350 (+) Transcript_18303:2-1051(+)
MPYPDAAGPNGTSYVIGRTMELSNLMGSTTYDIEVVPRNETAGTFGYLAPMSIFKFLTITTKVPAEGMNEHGFSVSALLFSQSRYEEPQEGLPSLRPEDVVGSLLAHCADIQSALKYLGSVRVTAQSELFDLHWALVDATGRSVVVEYLEGQRVVYENAPRVMTNDPDLKWHWRNLNTLTHLSPNFPTDNKFMEIDVGGDIGAVPRTVGHGWNLAGLPGDFSPPSRFSRLFYLRGYAMHARPLQSEADAIVLGTGLLNNVFIPMGTVAPDPAAAFMERLEYTPYGILKNPQQKTMMIRGYRNSQWKKLDLKHLDFSKVSSWPLEDGSLGVKDITDKGTPSQDEIPEFSI